MKDIRIVVVTPHRAGDPRPWSGTPYFLLKALKAEFSTVEVISGTKSSLVIRVLRKALRPFRIDPLREMLTSKIIATLMSAKIRRMKPDIVFGIAASHMIASLDVDAPIIHFSDATFEAMVEYNEEFSGLSKRTIRQGNAQELATLSNAALVLVASDWAACSAIKDYGAPPSKVVTLPMGANLESWPDPAPSPRSDNVLKLLFVGTNWQQKGGDVAFEVMNWLKARGLAVELHVVGCTPPAEFADESLYCHGFLRKGVPAETEQLNALFRTASFFLLPTRAEAYGLVFAEASAYGLPIAARRTGGTPSVVEDGVNGVLIDDKEGAEAYAAWIFDCWQDTARYERLRQSSRRKFEQELNWDAWRHEVGRLAERLVQGRTSRTSPLQAFPLAAETSKPG